jgi:hypothetical protein
VLHVSHPSISAQLKQLEESLGHPFSRVRLGGPVYSAVLDEILRSSRLKTIGIAKGLRIEIFAITAQRRLQHPGVIAMTAIPK